MDLCGCKACGRAPLFFFFFFSKEGSICGETWGAKRFVGMVHGLVKCNVMVRWYHGLLEVGGHEFRCFLPQWNTAARVRRRQIRQYAGLNQGCNFAKWGKALETGTVIMSADNRLNRYTFLLCLLPCVLTPGHVFRMRIITSKSSDQKWDKNLLTAYYAAGSLLIPQKEPPILWLFKHKKSR